MNNNEKYDIKLGQRNHKQELELSDIIPPDLNLKSTVKA